MSSLQEAENRARKVVNKWALINAGFGFIPGGSIAMAGGDVKIVNDVARIFDVKDYSAEEIITVIAATVAGRTAADAGLSWFPGLGWAVKSGVAAATTKAAGEMIIQVFKEKSALPPGS